ncbi:hypothetical protein PC41400_21680 [Paenibacillus chitinolyticus]|uniref:Uncharacterized protein n=1 Tax=Paenibacillus chitinolyticus TaxID=79263 RepID=A0A410X0N6_9BACL|nr:hypothetical protein [Paenibacillus chitinolyticus]MCY9593744.1 hypothetical protein [Paenibacillus chitinolyticus]MCY9599691.1 hypothetical protein [Paenibacillus chitinolyticus]QAV20133.1 hypothetical protein PC41400_21680 [Paenibacillus chitinolyticus]
MGRGAGAGHENYGNNRMYWIASTNVNGTIYCAKVICVSARSALVQGSGELEKMLKEDKIKLPDDWTVRVVSEKSEHAFSKLDSI